MREGLSHYDLDAVIYPCPRNGPTWRPRAVADGGKAMFPLLYDPNTGTRMYESADILRYLAAQYGDGDVPWGLAHPVVAPLLISLSLLPRLGAGGAYRPSRVTADTLPVTYWGYETSVRLVLLAALQCFNSRLLLTRTRPLFGSPFAAVLQDRALRAVRARGAAPVQERGTRQPQAPGDAGDGRPLPGAVLGGARELLLQFRPSVNPHVRLSPSCQDPNTGVKTFESAAIVRYLELAYAL